MAPGEEPVRTISMAKRRPESGAGDAPAPETSEAPAAPDAPRQVRTVVVRPDGTIISNSDQVEKPAAPSNSPASSAGLAMVAEHRMNSGSLP